MAFAIKAEVCDPRAKLFAFTAQKTMYGGKHIAEGDTARVRERERGRARPDRAASSLRRSDREKARHRPANTA
jgi:hypothetical protein